MLKAEDWATEAQWLDEENLDDPSANSQDAVASKLRRVRDADASTTGGDDPPIWQYLVSLASGLSHWEFHQYDNDPYPSVPHGHKLGNHKWKLDAYQGWVYERSRQASREPRWKIVSLWNDSRFRTFALDALEYYIEHFPHHSDWRITNPLRLPRRR